MRSFACIDHDDRARPKDAVAPENVIGLPLAGVIVVHRADRCLLPLALILVGALSYLALLAAAAAGCWGFFAGLAGPMAGSGAAPCPKSIGLLAADFMAVVVGPGWPE